MKSKWHRRNRKVAFQKAREAVNRLRLEFYNYMRLKAANVEFYRGLDAQGFHEFDGYTDQRNIMVAQMEQQDRFYIRHSGLLQRPVR